MKDKLIELLNELEYNQSINFKNDLENRIDVDYIIERITGILKGEDND